MFSADYVVPPALSIPLGTSGSSVDVVKEENGTFSINGETITAETRVTAENGNVYRALLSPEGMPIGVDHVAAMQDVMLGSLGGTITLTQSEDKSWMLGDITVTDGYVHTAANGNMYALMMDADGMWSGMYQEVMVTVALGTRGSVTLTRSEDMSWWLGSESVMNGSMVNSANGNEYMLSMSDGDWTAMFQPVSMMIEGTGLTAMTREGDDMYDVGDATLPASGKGDVTVDGAMYHVWMMDGALMGARFDKAIHGDTDLKIGDIALPTLLAEDEDTAATELRTKLSVADRSFAFSDLLGSGTASDMGDNIVAKALGKIQKTRDDVSALLSLDTAVTGLNAILTARWAAVQTQVNTIFGSGDDLVSIGHTNSNPGEDDILDEIDDVIAALSSEDAFAAATMKDGSGVFKTAELNDDDARNAFNAGNTETMVAFGTSGVTRFGAVTQKARKTATADLKYQMAVEDDTDTADDEEKAREGYNGAFAYSTVDDVLRTRDLPSTGNAYYEGETRAVSGDGKLYAGDIELQIRFRSGKVSALITNFGTVAEGESWIYQYGDVESIILPVADLNNNAGWNETVLDTATSNKARITFARRAGSPTPQEAAATFTGELTGIAAQGDHAHGTWSLGMDASAGNDYLSGGYGAVRTSETDDSRPGTDDGAVAKTAVFSEATENYNDGNSAQTRTVTTQSIDSDDGVLKVTTNLWGRVWEVWEDTNNDNTIDADDDHTYNYRILTQEFDHDDDTATTAHKVNKDSDFKVDLAKLMADPDQYTQNGPKQVDQAKGILQKARSDLAVLQALETRVPTSEAAQWTAVQHALAEIFKAVPAKFAGAYDEDDALGLIDRALDALSTQAALTDAVDPDGTGIFKAAHLLSGSGANAKYRAVSDIWGRKHSRLQLWSGMTDYTRFGAWRKQRNAYAVAGYSNSVKTTANDSRDTPQLFAYSQLPATTYSNSRDPSFPSGGSASYSGNTVAMRANAGGYNKTTNAHTMATNTDFYEGNVKVDVTWFASWAKGKAVTENMVTTISNLRHGGNGDPLTYGSARNEIDSIVISGVYGVHTAAGKKANQIQFDSSDTTTDFGSVNGTTLNNAIAVRVTYVDRSTPDTVVVGTHSISGAFVGKNVDGPLGVIGVWSVDPSGEFTYDHDNDTSTTDFTLDEFGGHTGAFGLRGAFGADAP